MTNHRRIDRKILPRDISHPFLQPVRKPRHSCLSADRQGGDDKISKPKTEIPKQVRDDKRPEPNHYVVLNLFQHLVCFFLLSAHTPFIPVPAYRRQAQDGVFRCDLNKILGDAFRMPNTDLILIFLEYEKPKQKGNRVNPVISDKKNCILIK